MVEVKTSHMACFTLCIIILSSILTQRFLMSNEESNIFEKMSGGLIDSSLSAKNMLKNALNRIKEKTWRNRPLNDTDITLINSPYEGNDHHPMTSPRLGTNIHPDNHGTILNCRNQSHCIVPDLQLHRKFKIYFCTKGVSQGIRFFYLAREGLLLHPNVELVKFDNIDEADLIIYLPASSAWHKTECRNPDFANRLLVLEEFDGDQMYSPYGDPKKMIEIYGPEKRWYFMYFKRSLVHRRDGKFISFRGLDHPDIYPMVYSIANSYSQHKFNHQRNIDITCTLRGNKQMSTRLRVQQWVAKYTQLNNITNTVQGELNHDTRTKISKTYFEKLFNSKIIVTVNPAHWEGDFRLWESLATGALVMVDHIFVPYPHPLVDQKHIIFFDNQNETDFLTKLHYYHTHPKESRKIAIAGYLYAMKYHRTVSMMDYFLRSAHLKLAEEEQDEGSPYPLPMYRYTAQFLMNETHKQHHTIRKHQRPGTYIH